MAKYVRLRAPKEHGETLQLPPISAGPDLVRSNREVLRGHTATLQGIRDLARQEIKALAVEYSASYLESGVCANSDSDSIVMSGHQPTLFHPGVWFKNFALDSIANRANATAINLVVDNDLCEDMRVRVPAFKDRDRSTARMASVAIDGPALPMPFEMRQVVDHEAVGNFPKSLGRYVGGWPADQSLLCNELWPEVLEASKQLSSLPSSIAAGRHRLEVKHGITNLELPVSILATSRSFSQFVDVVISDAQRFREIYNEELASFRKVNRIRSKSHPVPELEMDGEYVELPFWVWTKQNTLRRRLFSRLNERSIELSDRNGWTVEFSAASFATSFQELNRLDSYVFIRPRALATTMYCRLFASDLFIHGIGGAKYDQLGDEIVRRFFDVMPAKFMTVSATMKLPFEVPANVKEQITSLEIQLRQLRYHPDREMPDDPRAEKKRALVCNRPSSGSRKSWHDEIAAINVSMFEDLELKRMELASELKKARLTQPISNLLGSREFSFALFPIELIQQLKDLAT